MLKCLTCLKEHDGSYGSGIYCSRACANTRRHTAKAYTTARCVQCNKEVSASIHTSPQYVKCNDCIRAKQHLKSTHACPVCGEVGYRHNNCPRPQVCRQRQTIRNSLIVYFGFDQSVLGSLAAYKEYDRVKDALFVDYWDDNMTLLSMGEKYNYPQGSNIEKILTRLGMSYRNRSDAAKLSTLLSRSSPKGNYRHKRGMHAGWDGTQHFFRSSYEEDLMYDMDECMIQYGTETVRIAYWDSVLCTDRIAVVDFHLPEYNVLVEVKSEYTLNHINMHDKFISYRKQGYTPYVLLEKERVLDYNAIAFLSSQESSKLLTLNSETDVKRFDSSREVHIC